MLNNNEINESIDEYKKEMIERLAEFVSINSIYDETSVDKNNPFGRGVSEALSYFQEVARKDGFNVVNYDNYCVEISYGEGEILDILAHCDVVEVSSKWEFNPFSKLYDDKYVYGRGTQDDKGPLLAAYYALKVIKDKGITPSKKIRFIVGGNEESGSRCLKHYYKTLKKEYPSLGFTPDSSFPLINGEKGITRVELILDNIDKRITKLYGGKALNIVMDEAFIEIDGKLKKYQGKPAHASNPDKGINAFIELINDLKDEYKEFERLAIDLSDYKGRGLGINSYDEYLKDLTMNIGKVELKDSKLHIILDIRFPLSTNARKIKEIINNKGYECNILMEESPIYMDENSELVKTLLSSYNEFTNRNDKPFTIGGGTYAKSSKNVVAFGMLFEDDLDLMHQDNERIRIDHYLLGAKIYLKALLELIK